jgi:hypothetical protein
MIEIKDKTPAPPESKYRKATPAYISSEPRIAGILHVLDIRKAQVSALAMLDPVGLIRQVELCTCTAPSPPFHIKPGAHCVYLRVGPWFITVRYW